MQSSDDSLRKRHTLLEQEKHQNELLNKLKTMEQQSEETNDIGISILETLQLQREQLNHVDKSINLIDEDINKADVLLNNIEYAWWHPMYWINLLKIKVLVFNK
jgi:hypothetical protein